MVGAERRTILASLGAGVTDLLFAVIALHIGFSDWYWNRFHLFGVVGFGLLSYAFWHLILFKFETGERIWLKKKA